MPKVNVYEPSDGPVASASLTKGLRVSIGWAKGQHAQIGIGWVDPDAKPCELVGNVDWAADFMVDGDSDEQGRIWRAKWINLDRATINRLIRELRKVRDEAFGRDE